MKHGFIPDTIEQDHYVFGAQLPYLVLRPDGQWDMFLPPSEIQRQRGIETCNCSGYGLTNALEILIACMFGTRANYSERYTGIVSGTRPPGNSPHKVHEATRKYGVIEDKLLPFDESVQSVLEYYSPDPMSEELLAKGREWLDYFEFGHDWTFLPTDPLGVKQAKMIEALKSSPLQVSVYAGDGWELDAIHTKLPGFTDNHWVVCYGYVEGEYWKIFDSYDYTIKKVAWNTDFMQSKRISLKRKESVDEKKLSLFQRILQAAKELLQILSREKMMLQEPNVVNFCKAIQDHEGWFAPNKDFPIGSVSWRNKNAGNIRCNVVKNKFAVGVDPAGFCIFPDEAIGFKALTNLVQNAIDGKSKVYKPTMTFYQFFEVYAPSADKNNPKQYAEAVARKLGVEPTFTIKQLA